MEFDRAAADRILRRASELGASSQQPEHAETAMSEDVLVAAAAEVGIAPELVRVSVALERLGPAPVVPKRRLGGPEAVAVERVLDVDANTALARVDELLVRQHQLRRARARDDRGEWCRRPGAAGAVRRMIKNVNGEATLGSAERVSAHAVPVDAQRSAVRVEVDRSRQRRGSLTGGTAVAGSGLAGVGVLALVTAPAVLVAAPLALVAGVAVAARGGRQADAVRRELDGLLDAVERDVRPTSLTTDVRRMLRR